MTEADVEVILQRAHEKSPTRAPRIIRYNGPQFIARDRKAFIRELGMTHVRTAPGRCSEVGGVGLVLAAPPLAAEALYRFALSSRIGDAATGSRRRTRSTGAGRPWTAGVSRQRGGAAVGRIPTDKGKPGSKHHVLTDRQGIPLAIALTVHDSRLLAPLLDAVPAIRTGRRGRPRRRPIKLHANKGYDYRRCRDACVQRGIKHRIARKGIESKTHLGRHRWVVERTLAWTRRMLLATIGSSTKSSNAL